MFGASFLVHLLISKKPVESLEVEQKLSKSMNQKKQRESPWFCVGVLKAAQQEKVWSGKDSNSELSHIFNWNWIEVIVNAPKCSVDSNINLI